MGVIRNYKHMALMFAATTILKTKTALAFEKMGKECEAIGETFRNLAAIINQEMDRILYEANDNPKWWHLYKHAKKYRTRKKYRRRLMEQLLSKLGAASA